MDQVMEESSDRDEYVVKYRMPKSNRKYILILDHVPMFQNGRTLIARVCMDITESMDLQ